MYIHGTSHVHAAQSLAAPHRSTAAAAPTATPSTQGVDQLDISPQADLINQVKDLPEIRADRVADIKARIANGTYETENNLDLALSRLLDEIA